MTFYLLGALVVFATFGTVTIVAAAAIQLVWPLLKDRLAAVGPRRRSRLLLALRLAPSALGLIACASVSLPAYLRFEPRDTDETAGTALLLLGAAGLGIAVLSAARLVRAALCTRNVRRAWTRGAAPVAIPGAGFPVYRLEERLPVVALAGWRRPALFVAGTVLDHCEPRLLSAITAHEAGHQRAADNLRRLVLTACADPLAFSQAGREMSAAWETAAEEAADDDALSSGTAAVDLADALVTVARLAPAERWPDVPAAAFYRGDRLDRRVRRLLRRPGAAPLPVRGRAAVAVLLTAALWLLAAEALHLPVHRLVERAVDQPQAELRSLVVDNLPS
jgi:Zn-dependent protease with chaperone function